MKGLIIALQFMTRIPLPVIKADDHAFGASMRWFPATGLVIGLLVAGAGWAGAHLGDSIGALAALLVWTAITGALHLDGLADMADASGAIHKGLDKLLSVLADPHVGSFGVVAVVLQLLAKFVLLDSIIGSGLWWGLILIPFAARIGPLLWTWLLPPLHDGLASRFHAAIRPVHIGIWIALLCIFALAASSPALLITPLPLLGWNWHIRRLLGGISGDAHGAGIEVTESLLLFALLLGGHLA